MSPYDLRRFDLYGAHADEADSYFKYARKVEPIFFSEVLQSWCVTRYDDVKTIALDPIGFSSAEALPRPKGLPAETKPMLDLLYNNSNLTFTDPPGHAPVRRIVHEGFNPRTIASFEPAIREIIERQLDTISGKARFDLVAEFTDRITLAGVMRVIGFPEADGDRLRVWVNDVVSVVAMNQFLTSEALVEHGRSFDHAIAYLLDLVAQRHAAPQRDLITFMAETSMGGRELSDMEVANLAINLLTAGWETTGNGIDHTVRALLEEPSRWDRLVRGEASVEAVAMEGLRYKGVTSGLYRSATRHVVIAGVPIQEGDSVLLLFGSANRDEEKFENAEEFQMDRKPTVQPLSFGQGIHNCVGAPLAKMEMRLALECLAARFPGLSLDREQTISRKKASIFQGLEALWLTT